MKEHVDKIYEILRKLAKKEKFPLIIQGPVLCGAYHCCETELKKPSEYTSDIQIKDVILNSALRKNGILVSSISRIYPNITLSRKDVDWFEERAGQAIREAKQLIDELYE
jgi:glutamate-1-semialdehyde 2,1-aminomutase